MDTNNTESTFETLWNSTLWLLLFIVVLPLISSFIFFISGLGYIFLDNESTFGQILDNLSYNLITSIISIMLLLPFIKHSLCAKNKSSIYSRLALKKISFYPLIISLVLVLILSLLEYLLFSFGIIEPSSFMEELMAPIDTILEAILLFFTIALIAPIFEEIIFRGIFFYQLEQTSLSPSSIIIITSIIFTIVHVQYDQIEVYILVFISSCLLGGIRQLTGNLWYCIIGHITMNTLALTS